MYGKNKLLFSILILGTAFGQAFAQYEMKKHSINSGGSKMTGGSYEMNASIAQPDASNTQTGGAYFLNGGFWHESKEPLEELIFKSGFE